MSTARLNVAGAGVGTVPGMASGEVALDTVLDGRIGERRRDRGRLVHVASGVGDRIVAEALALRISQRGGVWLRGTGRRAIYATANSWGYGVRTFPARPERRPTCTEEHLSAVMAHRRASNYSVVGGIDVTPGGLAGVAEELVDRCGLFVVAHRGHHPVLDAESAIVVAAVDGDGDHCDELLERLAAYEAAGVTRDRIVVVYTKWARSTGTYKRFAHYHPIRHRSTESWDDRHHPLTGRDVYLPRRSTLWIADRVARAAVGAHLGAPSPKRRHRAATTPAAEHTAPMDPLSAALSERLEGWDPWEGTDTVAVRRWLQSRFADPDAAGTTLAALVESRGHVSIDDLRGDLGGITDEVLAHGECVPR